MKTTSIPARRAAMLLMAGALLPLHGGAAEPPDSYPSRAITFLLPYAVGSGSDQWVRNLGQLITKETKVPVIVDNKPGANGFIAAQHAARAAPDGYTILLGGQLTHALNQLMFKKLPYDPVGDFTPLTLAMVSLLLEILKRKSSNIGNTGLEPMAPPAICNCLSSSEEDTLNFISGMCFYAVKRKDTVPQIIFDSYFHQHPAENR